MNYDGRTLTFEEKLQVFNDMLAVPTISVEERYWIDILKQTLERGDFHDTWGRLQVQAPRVANIILSAIEKARAHARETVI